MIKVIFQNSREEREIGIADTEREAFKIVHMFLQEHNYKSYYTRCWIDENNSNRTIVDVGSWSEFFILDNDNKESE